MSASDVPEQDRWDWLPDATRELVQNGAIQARTPTLDLGDIPDGTTVELTLGPIPRVQLQAGSVGRQVKLVVRSAANQRALVVPAAIRRVELVGPLRQPVLMLSSGHTRVAINAPGKVTLARADTATNDKFATRVEVEAVTSSGGPADVELTTGIDLSHLHGTGNVTLCRAGSGADRAPLSKGSKVELAGDLHADAPLDVDEVVVSERCTAPGLRGAICAGYVDVTAPRKGQGDVLPGSTVTADGDISVSGNVDGSDTEPVTLRAGDGGRVTVGGRTSHCTIGAHGDGVLAAVDVKTTDHVTIEEVAEIDAAGRAVAPCFRARDKLTVHQATQVRRLEAATVNVRGLCGGTGTIKGAAIVIGPTDGTDEAAGPLTVEVSQSLRVEKLPANLDVVAQPEGETAETAGPSVQAAVGLSRLPGLAAGPPTPHDASYQVPHLLPKNARSRSRLAVRGPAAVWVGGPCHVTRLDGPAWLAAADDVTFELDESATAGHVHVSGVVKLNGGVLTTSQLRCAELLSGEVGCEDLHVSGGCRDVTATVSGPTTIAGDVTGTSHLELHGDCDLHGVDETVGVELSGPEVTLHAPAPGTVRWQPEALGTLTVHERVGTLDVKSPAEQVTVDLGEEGGLGRLVLSGIVQVRGVVPERGDRLRPPVPEVCLHDAAELTLEVSGKRRTDVAVTLAGTCRVAGVHDSAGTADLTVVAANPSGTLAVSADPSSRAVTGVVASSEADRLGELPDVRLLHGRFRVDGGFRRLRAGDDQPVDDPDHRPLLTVAAGAFVSQLSGRFGLESCSGRLIGVRPPSRLVAGYRRLRGRSDDPFEQPAVLLDRGRFRPSSEAPELRGMLVDVDVSELRFAELGRLDDLDVFSPLPGPLMDLGSKRPRSRAERHDAAQRLAVIAELTSGRAVPGATRSRVFWALARSHHRVARPLEWSGRWLHYLVGYSHRPLTAWATLAILLVLAVAGVQAFEPSACPSTDQTAAASGQLVSTDYSLVEQGLRVLTGPLGLLRLHGAENYPAVGCHAGWQLTVTIPLAVVLIFAVIATRNYMRSPADDG